MERFQSTAKDHANAGPGLEHDVPLPIGDDASPDAKLAGVLRDPFADDEPLAVVWDRIDARLYRINQALAARTLTATQTHLRRWWASPAVT